jgi:hypothetical protein
MKHSEDNQTMNKQTLDPKRDAGTVHNHVEGAVNHLESFADMLMDMAFFFQQPPQQDFTIEHLRSVSLFMSSTSYLMNELATRYWAMIPVEQRLIQQDKPPILNVGGGPNRRSKVQ